MAATKLESSRLLLVEGKDDQEFFNHLWSSLGPANDKIDVISYDGRDKLRNWLKTVSDLPGFVELNALGIVRDADDNPSGAFESVRDALRAFFDKQPTDPFEFIDATFQNAGPFDGQRFSVGIAILPGASRSGELEDLLVDAIDDPERMACVDEYIHCLESNEIPLEKPAKTRLQAFLASKEKAEKGLWKALKKNHIPVDSSVFDEVRTFLSGIADL